MNALKSEKKFEGVFYRESKRREHNGRPDRSYTICYNHNNRKVWVSLGWASLGVTAEAAYSARLDILRRVKLGQAPVKVRTELSVSQAMEHYINWMASENKHASPVRSIYNVWIKPHCGNLSLDSLNYAVLAELKIKAAKKLAPASLRGLFSNLRAGINHAIRWNLWQGTNPISRTGMSVPPEGEKCERFLTPEEAQQLLDELQKTSPVWHDMVLFSLHTGARSTEVFKIQGQDINEAANLVMLTLKGGKREPAALTSESLEVLIRNRKEPNDFVFRRKNDAPFYRACGTAFDRAVKTLGFNNGITGKRHKVWFHTLRHTFASWLAQDGVDIYALKNLMRHKNIEMTMRYAHLIPERQKEHLTVIRKRFSAGCQ